MSSTRNVAVVVALLFWLLPAKGKVDWISAAMAASTVPVPVTTIYPGEKITANLLRPARFLDGYVESENFVRHKRQLIGKVARRTLVRGRPIRVNSVRQAFAVRHGQLVTFRYRSGPLLIVAKAISLKSAIIGESIEMRNIDSGRTVSGIVQHDGTVLVTAK